MRTTTFVLIGMTALTLTASSDEPKPEDFRIESPDPARRKALEAARERIAEIIRPVQAVTGLWFKDLQNGDVLALRPDHSMHPASTIKTPILVENFKDIEAGKYSLDQEFTVEDTFPSLVDGSPFKTEGKEEITAAIGKKMKLRRIIELMIHLSDNLATNNCTKIAGGAAEVSATMTSLGLDGIVCARFIEDQKAFLAGLSSKTNARHLGTLYEKIAKKEVVSPKACETMIEILFGCTGTHTTSKLPKDAVRFAHKTGSIEGILHDSGILFAGDRKYILVTLMSELKTPEKEAEGIQADIAKAIYDGLIAPGR